MKGYKVFRPDWTCRGFQYEVGGVYKMDTEPVVCERGFHFCENLNDCFAYYPFDPANKVAVVEASGSIVSSNDGKFCTNEIAIVKEISWEEVLQLVNTGKACTGRGNSGNWNSGNWNSGNWNSGNWNTGNRNTGDRNSGNRNTGDRNSGNWNSGNWNTGNWNTGDRNSGNRNTGDRNSGNWNSGNWNTGNWNTGDCNTGDCNTGNRNTGDRNSGNWNSGNWNTGNWNTGDCNTGDCNTGDCNTGDWNTTSFSSGCFCTEESKILMFNKQSSWTLEDWWRSEARSLLHQIPHNVVEWIWSDDMTDEEKEAHPEHTTTGGYLKILEEAENAQNWWNGLSESDRNVIRSIPNFDPTIFKQCTGIDVNK